MVPINLKWDMNKLVPEGEVLARLIDQASLSESTRAKIVERASDLVGQIRNNAHPGLMEIFLSEYGLSTDEGVALMCLAEALLRVPDNGTIDALIEDKVTASNWSAHLGQSSSPLVNASTWALMLTGKVLSPGGEPVAKTLRALTRRLGEPVIRQGVRTAIKQMGAQFVLGQDIAGAMKRAKGQESKGYTYSYDMLGEAALTSADAARYFDAYRDAIDSIGAACTNPDIATNPGISVKLSALHPRYETAQAERVLTELVPKVRALAARAASFNMGFNIDAEEADRLGLSLEVVGAVLRAITEPNFPQWEGFGVVVQAYSRRGDEVIDALYGMARANKRKIMVRLVKGAYWDTEIKHAQVEGLSDFPVFTEKAHSDVSYISLANKLTGMTDWIYPQFATHNAHSIAAVLEITKEIPKDQFEFQRLHGMGETLHDIVMDCHNTQCRIYAPVGPHRDLLAYLVRRLLENGANSSFVNQIVDQTVPISSVVACPFAKVQSNKHSHQTGLIPTGPDLYQPQRQNSKGWDLSSAEVLKQIAAERILKEPLHAGPIWAQNGSVSSKELERKIELNLDPSSLCPIGEVSLASADVVEQAFSSARTWSPSVQERARILNLAADLYEKNAIEAFALLAKEAGKTLKDAVGEVREAVDFLRYYAAQALIPLNAAVDSERGIFVCISPWNFPCAIFTGQIAAALVSGNAVLAKPAETTPAIAAWCVQLLHQAGVPKTALQLLPGEGREVGVWLTADRRVNGVAFTGSTATARTIQQNLAENARPGTPLVAETGGLNAMIVDSTALAEQAIVDIVASAFQSAGQRCSALRCLYVQEDIFDGFLDQLKGAMDQLVVGDPWDVQTDIGPIISVHAALEIEQYCQSAAQDGRLLHRTKTQADLGDNFVAPTLISVDGIGDLDQEVFGPVLHIAPFHADDLDNVLDDINNSGFGLTFGIHSRIDSRIQNVVERLRVGNVYANRNQIGAVVGSQPFGGEGQSGTGPKAGGPNYLARFRKQTPERDRLQSVSPIETVLPGPTGELNRLKLVPRPPVVCAGPGVTKASKQQAMVEQLGATAAVCVDFQDPTTLAQMPNISGIIWWGDEIVGKELAYALTKRTEQILPLITGVPDIGHLFHERHLCVDTTAAGGNAALLGQM